MPTHSLQKYVYFAENYDSIGEFNDLCKSMTRDGWTVHTYETHYNGSVKVLWKRKVGNESQGADNS